MILRPPIATLTYTLLPYTTLFRAVLDTDVAMAVDGVATFRAYRSDRFLGCGFDDIGDNHIRAPTGKNRSEEHTSELQSLMRISYAVFCLNKKRHTTTD